MNEATILRFEYDTPLDARLRPTDLVQIVQKLEAVLVAVSGQLGEASIETFIVASPRRGSIEILIQPIVNLTINVDVATSFAQAHGFGPGVLTMAEAAAVGTFIWHVCFGDRGLLDLFNGRRDEASVKEASVAFRISEASLLSRNIRMALTDLAARTLRAGATRVEIQVPDSPAVVIVDQGARMRRGLIGRLVAQRTDYTPDAITRIGDDIVRVRFRGEEYRAFLSDGPRQGANGIVLWASSAPLPPPGGDPVRVESEGIGNLDDIEPLDPVPPSFDHAVAGVVVRRAQTWT